MKQNNDTHQLSALSAAMEIVTAATAHTFRYIPGASVRAVGPLHCYHYDKPMFWETDAFQAVEVEPADVIAAITSYRPGPHLIAVVTDDPQSVVAPYAALGYKTAASEPIETVMARPLTGFVPGESVHSVRRLSTEADAILYNSVKRDHGQMTPAELRDANVRYYVVEKDGKWVCEGKAILPSRQAVVVEPLGTHSDYRRRGLATAVMNRILADAVADGAEQSVIIATDMGRALYATLGYTVVGYIQKFVPQEWNRADYP